MLEFHFVHAFLQIELHAVLCSSVIEDRVQENDFRYKHVNSSSFWFWLNFGCSHYCRALKYGLIHLDSQTVLRLTVGVMDSSLDLGYSVTCEKVMS